MSKISISGNATRHSLINLFRRLHFYSGLFVGPFIFVAALTGTLYVITPQLENTLYASALTTENRGQAASLAEQINAARRYAGEDKKIYAVRPAPNSNDTTRVQFVEPQLGESESRAVFIDPYTLDVRGDYTVYGTSGSLPLRMWLDQLHRGLLLGDLGRNYSELAASWLWVAALGGVVLWLLSRPKRQLKKARGRFAIARNGHITLGLFLLSGLLFFSVTGLTWSQWAGNNIDKMRTSFNWLTPQVSTTLDAHPGPVIGDPHAEHTMAMAGMMMPTGDNETWQQVLAAARTAGISAQKVEIRAAKAAGKAWTVTEVDRSWPTQVDAVSVDPRNMRIVDHVYFERFPLIAKLTRWGIDFHMGILFGLPNQLILAVFGIGLCVMIVLGYRMWWLRRPAAPENSATDSLADAWLALPVQWRALSLMIAALLGYCLPVMGVSLLAFLLLDILRWRHQRRGLSQLA